MQKNVINSIKNSAQENPSIKYILWIFLLFITIYLVPLGDRPLIIPDETRYAEIPREMINSGDWTVPRLNDLRYFEKPPMGYWLNAISLNVFGENSFAVRFSGAISVLLTGCLVFLLTMTAGFDRKIAYISTIIYLTSLGVYLSGTFSVLDSMLSLFLTAGIGFFYIAIVKEKPIYWILAGIAFGCSFLTKGFLAFAVPVIVLIPWLIWIKQPGIVIRWGWLIVLTAFFIALPWGISIHNREPDFWNYFFWVQHINRFAGENAQHQAPFYYFIMYFPLLAFPWASFLPAAINNLRHNKEISNNLLIKLSSLWVIIPFIFFSVSSGKLATYILPIFPPLAILLGVGLYKCAGLSKKLISFGILFNALAISAMLLFLITSKTLISVTDFYQNEYSKYAAYIVTLSVGLLISVFAFKENSNNRKLNLVLITIIPFLFVFNFGVPEYSYKIKSPGPLLEQHQNLNTDNAIVITSGSLVRAVSWYFKREDIFLYSKNEVRYGLGYEDSKHKYVDSDQFKDLILKSIQKKPLILICYKICPQTTDSIFSNISFQKYIYGNFILIHVPVTDANNHLISSG